MTAEPVHLLAVSGARRTMCGLVVTRKGPHPIMLLRWVPAHRLGHARAGRPFVLCPDCEREMP